MPDPADKPVVEAGRLVLSQAINRLEDDPVSRLLVRSIATMVVQEAQNEPPQNRASVANALVDEIASDDFGRKLAERPGYAPEAIFTRMHPLKRQLRHLVDAKVFAQE